MAAEPRVNGYGVVKSVLSGDTIKVFGASTDPDAKHPEKEIRFSGLIAPRFSRSKNQTDEAFAFESREFLRKLLIGKIVSFYTSNSAEGGRLYGTVYLNNENVNEMAIRKGWVTVKPPPAGQRVSIDRQDLMDIEADAKKDKVGMWAEGTTPEAHTRDINWNPDARALLTQFKGQEVDAVVTQIRDGSVIRLEVKQPKSKSKSPEWMVVSLSLAGARSERCPLSLGYRQSEYDRKKKLDADFDEEAPTDEDAPPFAIEAMEFVEKRLLHRDVKVVFLGAEKGKSNTVFGSILFPGGDITARILETGLAKFVPWTSKMLSDDLAKHYEALGRSAREKQVGLWKDNSAEEDKTPEKFRATVCFVQSGDLLVVKDDQGKEIKYALSSIHAKRLGNSARGEKDQPYALEAKECLRKKLIGKSVTVIPEYTRTTPSGMEITYASIMLGTENVSETLVQQGLADVNFHRQEDDRAYNYAKLLELEFQAVERGVGMHSKLPYSSANIVDFSIRSRKNEEGPKKDAGRARQYLGFLQRDKTIPAVVEFCFSAGRLKVFVPKHNVVLVLVLAGIRTPMAGDAYSEESKQYAKDRVLQHSVRIEVETVDKGDNFIGSVFYIGKNGKEQNLAVELLKQGLANVFGFSAAKSIYNSDLLTAESGAKEAKLKIWENYVEQVETVEEGADNVRNLKDEMTVEVCDVSDPTAFFVRITDEENISIVEKRMDEYNENPDTSPLERPKRGDVIAAKYALDDRWYRVRYDGPSGGDHKVFFIDFGNPEIMSKEALAPLPADLAKIPGLARACFLAGLKAPSKRSEYYHDAAVAFNGRAYGLERPLNAKVVMVDKANKLHLTLTDSEDESGLTINEQLVEEGWCRVIERPDRKLTGLCATLTKSEDKAKMARLNIWEYGDVSDDESEDEDARPKNDGRPPAKKY